MPGLYRRPLYVNYHANRVSCASFCTFLYVVAIIVLPYVATYALGGMWTKETLVREQPLVRFRYEALVEAAGTSPASAIVPIVWSTDEALNDAAGPDLRACELSAWEEDDERDGRPDRLQFVVRVPLDDKAGEQLHSFSAVFGVELLFQREFRLRLNASLRMEASSPLPGRALHQRADLTLRSKYPQRSKDLRQREPCPEAVWAFKEPVLPDGAPASAVSILGQYGACNDSALLVAQPPIWTPGVRDAFEASLTIAVPPLVTTRRPGCVHERASAALRLRCAFS